ncbi:hypothetical protein LI82_05035 [Methanococcoides methylutens]|uniref:Uncharacterized protein n=1 Tax=Methanococcoides methylutens TaxID=2226 RepID=A0A099T2G2_METMT|nr:hypothetical protein [Methanococcoides methylutens]KGK99370.1 hypothetical protein LI82_05035 [Methanococcoides methylutens]
MGKWIDYRTKRGKRIKKARDTASNYGSKAGSAASGAGRSAWNAGSRAGSYASNAGQSVSRAGSYASNAGQSVSRAGKYAYGAGEHYSKKKYFEASGYGYAGRSTINRGGRIVSGIARATENTAGAVSGSWTQMSWKLRGLLAFVLAFAIFFIPFGAFQYAGWGLYLSMAWIINGFYWFIATIMNAILNVFISSIDTIFQYVTEHVGGTYQSLESWTLTTGTLLNPDSFKPTEFDTRYLAQWVFDNFGNVFQDMYDYIKR